MKINILFFITFILTFCQSIVQNPDSEFNLIYDLSKPAEKFSLPARLTEISGIKYDKGLIFCIQDESSEIFAFDPTERKVTCSYNYGINGDFEDLTTIGADAYLLKSNGSLIVIKGFTGTNRTIMEYDTPLSSKNDSEGLAFDAASNSLLIACKGTKDVYRFSLHKRELIPAIYLSPDPAHTSNYVTKDLYEKFNLLKGKYPVIRDFRPSALAYHPSGDLYIISSAGRLLLVLDKNLKIKGFGYLSPEIFTQPEGITFSEKGDMYISNEGRNGPGYILLFRE